MRKIFLLGLLAVFIGISPVLINAWIGSDIQTSISFPQDDSTVTVPFTIRGGCWNTEQGVDYYEIWLLKDHDGDGEVSEEDFNNRQAVIRFSGMNIPDRTDIMLTPRYWMRTDRFNFEQDEKYFLFIYGMDLNGFIGYDTNIIGLTKDGDATRPANAIRYFTVSGYSP